MAKAPVVAIGIQARSTSKRFPGKVHQKIGPLTMLQHVCEAVEEAIRMTDDIPIHASVLIPKGDKILFCDRLPFPIVEGDLNDVLSRYMKYQLNTNADYIVRLTSDCPLLPSTIVHSMIRTAVKTESDYTSNVLGDIRLDPDGYDCEVISKRLLEFLDRNATHPSAREHVTSFLKTGTPAWAKKTFCYSELIDRSKQKLSVDTKQDLARVRRHYLMANRMLDKALGR